MQTYNIDVQYASQLDSTGEDDARISDLVPLVVNMMGWMKGLGADLSRKVIEIVQPSAVFDFEAPPPETAWPQSRAPDYVDSSLILQSVIDSSVPRHSLEAISPAVMSQRYSPADHRTLSILSYFHTIFASSTSPSHFRNLYSNTWDTALPLCAQPPYELDAGAALDSILLSGAGSEDVVPPEIHHVLNGAVVGLVSCEPGVLDLDTATAQDTAQATRGIPYHQGMPQPPPSMSTCYGLGLIRSVNPDTPARLHLLTPLPPAVLASVQPRVLVKGEMELPVWGMLDFRSEDTVAGVEKAKVPFLRWGKTEGTGGERRRVRRNLMRRGQQ